MASDKNEEKNFKKCLQSLIDAVSDAKDNLNAKAKEEKLINDLKKRLRNVLDKSLPAMSPQCRNYLLNLLYPYQYSGKDKTLSNSFTKDMLDPLLHDLHGRLASLDVFQAAWDGDQSAVGDFIATYPTLKDQSGLYQTTLLYSAARNNHFDLVKYLIEEGHCEVNAANEEHLEKGQAPSKKATIGSTALHAACFQGHLEIVKFLISHGGDYFKLNNANESPVENGKSKPVIRKFFHNFLFSAYSNQSNHLPTRTTLQVIEQTADQIVDCVWEYKTLGLDQWTPLEESVGEQLQRVLLSKTMKSEFPLKTGRGVVHISMAQLLRFENHDDQMKKAAWIRCRGSALLNFHSYSQWQIMFTRHSQGTPMSSPSIKIFTNWTTAIQLGSWYNADTASNLLLETAVNYRRRYVNLDLLGEKVTVDLGNFALVDENKAIEGFLRWIPKLIANPSDLTPIDNFRLSVDDTALLLKRSCVRKAQENGDISTGDIDQYDLKYENAFRDDNLEVSNKVRII